MSSALEVLDQLLGGNIPLRVVAGLFPDNQRCHQTIDALLEGGEVQLLDAAGAPVPLWRYRELERRAELWAAGAAYQLAITDIGANRVR